MNMYSDLLLNNYCYVLNKLFVKVLRVYYAVRPLLGVLYIVTSRGR